MVLLAWLVYQGPCCVAFILFHLMFQSVSFGCPITLTNIFVLCLVKIMKPSFTWCDTFSEAVSLLSGVLLYSANEMYFVS
jgi:hypothetical protein